MQFYNRSDIVGVKFIREGQHYIKIVWVRGHNYPFGEKVMGLTGPETIFKENVALPIMSFNVQPAFVESEVAA